MFLFYIFLLHVLNHDNTSFFGVVTLVLLWFVHVCTGQFKQLRYFKQSNHGWWWHLWESHCSSMDSWGFECTRPRRYTTRTSELETHEARERSGKNGGSHDHQTVSKFLWDVLSYQSWVLDKTIHKSGMDLTFPPPQASRNRQPLEFGTGNFSAAGEHNKLPRPKSLRSNILRCHPTWGSTLFPLHRLLCTTWNAWSFSQTSIGFLKQFHQAPVMLGSLWLFIIIYCCFTNISQIVTHISPKNPRKNIHLKLSPAWQTKKTCRSRSLLCHVLRTGEIRRIAPAVHILALPGENPRDVLLVEGTRYVQNSG